MAAILQNVGNAITQWTDLDETWVVTSHHVPAGRYQRRMHLGLVHSASGVCICCLALNRTNLFGTMMYGG